MNVHSRHILNRSPTLDSANVSTMASGAGQHRASAGEDALCPDPNPSPNRRVTPGECWGGCSMTISITSY